MAHAWWHPVGTTPLSEEEAWQGQGVDTAYTGAPDPGIERVAPELLLGGAGTLAAKGVMGAARPLWNVGKRVLTTKSPVTGNTILRPAIQKGLSRARTSVVRPGYSGAPKKGAMIRGPKGELLRAKFAGEGAYSPRLGPAGYVAGGLGLGYAVNKEEVDNMVSGMFSGDPMDDSSPDLNVAIDSPKRKRKPLPKTDQNNPDENPTNTPNLWKTWGSLADNPRQRKQAYIDSIKNIYMKKMLLDGIANLTGGVSQGGSWAEMAIAELDAMEKFDSEQRLHNQWKALFFNENGDYNPPKNREEAMERGQKLGYDADQMKDILTVFPKDTSKDKGGVATEQFEIWKAMPKGELKEAYGNLIGVNKGSDRGKITAYQAANLLKAYSDGSLEFDEAQLTALNSIMNTGLSGSAPTIEDSPSVPQQVESAGDSNLQAAKKRAAELQAQGKSREEIMSILRQEGLN